MLLKLQKNDHTQKLHKIQFRSSFKALLKVIPYMSLCKKKETSEFIFFIHNLVTSPLFECSIAILYIMKLVAHMIGAYAYFKRENCSLLKNYQNKINLTKRI